MAALSGPCDQKRRRPCLDPLLPEQTRGDLLPESRGHPATSGLEQLPSSTESRQPGQGPAEAPPALDGDYVQAQSSFPLETWTHLPVSAQQAEFLCSRVPWKEAHRNRPCDGRCPSRETLRGGDPHLCAVWAAARVFKEQKALEKAMKSGHGGRSQHLPRPRHRTWGKVPAGSFWSSYSRCHSFAPTSPHLLPPFLLPHT